MNLGLLAHFLNYFHHLPLIARINSQHYLGFFLSLMISSVASYDIFSYKCEESLCP